MMNMNPFCFCRDEHQRPDFPQNQDPRENCHFDGSAFGRFRPPWPHFGRGFREMADCNRRFMHEVGRSMHSLWNEERTMNADCNTNRENMNEADQRMPHCGMPSGARGRDPSDVFAWCGHGHGLFGRGGCWFPPHPPFGNGFRGSSPRARRGDVRTALLLLLAEGPRNGYQLMQEIEKRSNGAWRPSPGSTYPALQQLEDEGLVRVEVEGGSRLFHLTEMGKIAASEKSESQNTAPWDPANFGAESGSELRELMGQIMMAAMQVNHVGNSTQVAAARKILADVCRSLYQILAESENEDNP